MQTMRNVFVTYRDSVRERRLLIFVLGFSECERVNVKIFHWQLECQGKFYHSDLNENNWKFNYSRQSNMRDRNHHLFPGHK